MAQAVDFEPLSVDIVAVSLDSAKVTPAGIPPTSVVITCDDGTIRCRWDGTAPTSTTGHRLNPGGMITLDSRPDMVRFQAIRDDTETSAASVSVTYSR